jgi:hypothetical protein
VQLPELIIGMAMIGSHRAADMEMFEFRTLEAHPTRDAAQRRVVEYGLHVQCPWRIVRGHQVIVGYDDLRVPATDQVDEAEFDPNELGTTLREELLAAFFAERKARPPVVIAQTIRSTGDLTLDFDDGCALEAFADASGGPPDREYWRLMIVGGEHFVAGTQGFERIG